MKKCRWLWLMIGMLMISLLTGCGMIDKFSGRWVSEPSDKDFFGHVYARVLDIKSNGDKGYVINTYVIEYNKNNDAVQVNNDEKLMATKTQEGNTIRIQELLGNPPIIYDENSKTLTSDVGRMSGIKLEFKQVKNDEELEKVKDKVLEIGRQNNKK